MKEVQFVLRLAKTIRTPQQAAALIVVAALGVGIIYFIPADLIDRI